MKRSLPTSEVPPTPSSSSTNTHGHSSYYTSTFPSTSSNSTMPIGEESHQRTTTLSNNPSSHHHQHTASSFSHTNASAEAPQQQQQPFRPHSSLYFTSTSTNPFSSEMAQSSSTDCCQSINHSFKRVKISTSPGELRLNKDLLDMTTTTSSSPSWSTPHNDTSAKEMISSTGTAKLERDIVDPLRLKLSVLQEEEGNNKCWIFLIQVPRMYPHTPPVVYRVSVVPYAASKEVGGSKDVSLLLSGSQKNVVPPLLESVKVVSTCPHGRIKEDKEEEEGGMGTVEVYKDWSPISRLVDLIDFLRGLPGERRRKWEEYSRNPNRQQRINHCLKGGSGGGEKRVEDEENKKENGVDVQCRQYLHQQEQNQSYDVDPFSSSYTSDSTSKNTMALSQCQNNQDNNNMSSFPHKIKSNLNNIHDHMESGEKSGEYSDKESFQMQDDDDDNHATPPQQRQESHRHTPISLEAKKHGLFLNPNRFHVGYDTRHVPPPNNNCRMGSCKMEEDDDMYDDNGRRGEWRGQQQQGQGYGGQFGDGGVEVSAGGKIQNHESNWTSFRQGSVDTQHMMMMME